MDNRLQALDDPDESLWDSPEDPQADSRNHHTNRPSQQEQQDHDDALEQELQNVRQVNEAIEGVIKSLRKAKDNMKTVNTTVSAASTLLNTWTRILSQTEHNQRLILDPSWQGASQDIADIEDEALEKQRAVERRETEQEERKRTAARKAEEEEKRKAEVAARPAKPSARGNSRSGSATRGSYASTPSSSYVQMGGAGTTGTKRGTNTTRRPSSGIGRGVGRGGRGRG